MRVTGGSRGGKRRMDGAEGTKAGKDKELKGRMDGKDGEVRVWAGRRKKRDKWGKEKGGRMVD